MVFTPQSQGAFPHFFFLLAAPQIRWVKNSLYLLKFSQKQVKCRLELHNITSRRF